MDGTDEKPKYPDGSCTTCLLCKEHRKYQRPVLPLKVTIPHKMLYLNTSMTTEVKVKLWWMGDFCVHCGTSWNVSTFSNLCEQKMQCSKAHTKFFLFSCTVRKKTQGKKTTVKSKKSRKNEQFFLFNWKPGVSLLQRKKKKTSCKIFWEATYKDQLFWLM